MSNSRILIVDDDSNIAELISLYLTAENFETRIAYNGIDALKEFQLFLPQLILLDLMLPGLNGYDVCKEIRKVSELPIIMLTAKAETFDKVLGLELGADDYIVKPFDPKELVARVKAVLRRTVHSTTLDDIRNHLSYENLLINASNRTVHFKGKQIDLPPKEFDLLFYLASNPNQVFTREQLLDNIWGKEYAADTRTVDVHIKRLREKFEGSQKWSINTVWGIGYKFEVKS